MTCISVFNTHFYLCVSNYKHTSTVLILSIFTKILSVLLQQFSLKLGIVSIIGLTKVNWHVKHSKSFPVLRMWNRKPYGTLSLSKSPAACVVFSKPSGGDRRSAGKIFHCKRQKLGKKYIYTKRNKRFFNVCSVCTWLNRTAVLKVLWCKNFKNNAPDTSPGPQRKRRKSVITFARFTTVISPATRSFRFQFLSVN